MSFDALAESRERCVTTVVDQLYERHPEWVARWGPSGRENCTRDVGFTLAFAEAALRSGDPQILVDYSRWLANLLRDRGVPVDSARESYALLSRALGGVLPTDESARAAALFAAGQVALAEGASMEGGRAPLAPVATSFLDALLASNRVELERILRDASEGGMSMAQVADTIIQPAMTEVGARWARNELSVAQEHRATALVQLVLARFSPLPRGGARAAALIGCVEGNLHSLGARVVADTFEADGWDVHFMGADVPTRDLIAYVRAHAVDIIGLSVALPLHLISAQRVVAALRRELGAACPRIVVGGKPVLEFSRGSAFVAADALFSDAASGLHGAR